MEKLSGIINLLKPQGVTSRDCVNVVQRLARPTRLKVGHAGTLDPLARGVLVVCAGTATRLIEYVQKSPKCYEGLFLLGRESDTEDVEGTVTELPSLPKPTLEEITAALPSFMGETQQVPPVYSALKVKGRRAYDLARRGEEVTLQARGVMIHDLQVLNYNYPELKLSVTCGSGTYIRSLGRDIARHVGTEAVMAALTRTAIGDFKIAQAVTFEQLETDGIAAHLQPHRKAVASLPGVTLNQEQLVEVSHGRKQAIPLIDDLPGRPPEVAAYEPAGRLVAILAPKERGLWGPVKNFPDNGPMSSGKGDTS